MTRSHAVRAHVRRSPPRYSEDLHDRLRAEVVAEAIWSARVGPMLVEALEEALAPLPSQSDDRCTCRFGRDYDGSEFGPCEACERAHDEERREEIEK